MTKRKFGMLIRRPCKMKEFQEKKNKHREEDKYITKLL